MDKMIEQHKSKVSTTYSVANEDNNRLVIILI